MWDIWGGFISLTSIPDISTALMRPRRPKQYCLQLYIYIYIYIAEVLKTRSNLAAVALTVSFKFLGGAASWLVACKSNKYELLVHSQNQSLDLSMGGGGGVKEVNDDLWGLKNN